MLAVLAGTAVSGRSVASDAAFLEGLRSRRLFPLAETFCRQRLADEQLSVVDRGQLTIELIRVHAEHAVNTPPEDREPLWQKARDTAAEFLRRYPDHPRAILVRLQDALTLLAQGELARMEAEVGPWPAESLETARATIRQSARLLEELDRELTDAVPMRRRNATRPEELSGQELSSLGQNVRYQMARAFRNQALCYAAGSNDRVAALTQALGQLEKPLLELPADDPLAWQIRIDQIICSRLLGDFDAAQRFLASLGDQPIPPSLRLHMRAEEVRLQLARGEPQRALAILSQGRQLGGTTSAELDFAHLETYVALWRSAGDAKDESQAAPWREKAVAAVEFVEQTHGPYWGRRAELLLVATGRERGGGSVEILRRTADDFYLKGRFDECVAAYDNAAQAARDTSDNDQAFQLAYKAALVQQGRSIHGDASRRFRELALAMKSHAKAGNAHLLAAWNAAQLAQGDSPSAEHYAELLEEHIRFWPDADSSATARAWLGRLRQSRQDWAAAAAAYQGVPPSSPQFREAVMAAGHCWMQWLGQLKSRGEPVAERAAAAAEFLERVVNTPDQPLPEQWNDLARYCVVAAARIRLKYTADGFAVVEPMLKAALDGPPEPPAGWRSMATSLLVVALAGQQDRHAEAHALLRQIGDASPSDLLEMLEGISAVVRSAPDRAGGELAKLQLEAVELAWRARASVDDESRLTIERIRADSLAALGQRDKAIDAYADLTARHPNHGSIQEGYAALLLESDERPLLQRALDQWRSVAGKSRPRSPRWFRAKYSVALAQFKLGDKTAAAKLIRYLQVTENLDESGLKREFLDLLERCQQ